MNMDDGVLLPNIMGKKPQFVPINCFSLKIYFLPIHCFDQYLSVPTDLLIKTTTKPSVGCTCSQIVIK